MADTVRRTLAAGLRAAARQYPVVTVTGPRQSGKTTLCRDVFRGKAYISFEALDNRDRARDDPRGLIAEYRGGAIFDEIQHAPGLLSYLQTEVDDDDSPGRFVLTGSQQFGLAAAISQTLAGRTAMLQLLPLGLDEVRRFASPPTELWPTIFAGGYPRIHDKQLPPEHWLADYVATYVERDVRQVLSVGDLRAFTTFLRLAAGRTAQELNYSSLGADTGKSYNTIKSWISVLEASYVCFVVPAWHRNQRKRWVKAPKLHWIDTGLVCHLLGITDAAQLTTHPLRGAIFESWVASEILKAHVHRRETPHLFHFREVRGSEVDLGIAHGRRMTLVEAKSGATVSDDYFAGLRAIAAELAHGKAVDEISSTVVFGGGTSQRRSDATVVPWSAVADRNWRR